MGHLNTHLTCMIYQKIFVNMDMIKHYVPIVRESGLIQKEHSGSSIQVPPSILRTTLRTLLSISRTKKERLLAQQALKSLLKEKARYSSSICWAMSWLLPASLQYCIYPKSRSE